MRRLWFLLVVMLATVAARAADASGKWRAEFQTPDGQTRVNVFTLKASGDKLTGTLHSAGSDYPVAEGKVAGDEVSFHVMRNFGGNEVKVSYAGKVTAAEIQFKVRFGDQGEFDIVAKKQP